MSNTIGHFIYYLSANGDTLYATKYKNLFRDNYFLYFLNIGKIIYIYIFPKFNVYTLILLNWKYKI